MGRIWYPVIYVLSPKITNIISSESQAREQGRSEAKRNNNQLLIIIIIITIVISRAGERSPALKRIWRPKQWMVREVESRADPDPGSVSPTYKQTASTCIASWARTFTVAVQEVESSGPGSGRRASRSIDAKSGPSVHQSIN